MKKAVVTGIGGFAGSHLTEHLITKGILVFGFSHPDHSIHNLEDFKKKITLVPVNLLDKKKVQDAILHFKPDYVFHLAASSSPARSFKDPRRTLENNIIGELNLLEALVKIKSKARILIVGSADEYGIVDSKTLPVKETTPLSPISPYAVSKVAQDMLGLQFFLHHKLQIIRVRPFNHIGPRQSQEFVVSAFASQIAQLEKKGEGVMKVGDLNAWRDFTDVRDMVRAYLLALEKCVPGEVYNIGSGKAVKISYVLKKLLSKSGVKIRVEQDKNLVRLLEIKKIYCDFSKFHHQTGWKPTIDLSKTLFDTIDYERKKIN